MTCFGTCVPAGPSKKAAGCPFTCNFREGNCSLTHAMSNAFFAVPGMTGVLIFVCSRKPADFSELLVSHTFRRRCRGAACCAPTRTNPKALCGVQIGSTFLL